jgi:hypothetical protein
VPEEHSVQVDQPGKLYLPGPHAIGVALTDSDDGHAYPALQLAQAVQPASLYKPGGQRFARVDKDCMEQ